MGSDLVKALSNPFESAVHDCSQISSESDCSSVCCTCHSKTIAPDPSSDEETDGAPLENRLRPEEEFAIQSKENG